ncbi:MAG: EVE domain-containing protein [Vampirovibrio sp.]|jgi:predicted RNA-binding protein with PUA-like domain|nr:EVE domain-containing protein [Vampirovibrio sp.]
MAPNLSTTLTCPSKQYWLMKSEPEAYSWQRLLTEGKTLWEGVRNYQARNNLKQMQVNDLALFYHSVSEKAVVGVCKITQTAYPDPTDETGKWVVVNVIPVETLAVPVTLAAIKATEALAEIALVRQSRLSVVPLTQAEFDLILSMGA